MPLGSYLMCFRFLQVFWSFASSGELPHADHGHVEGVDPLDETELIAHGPTAAAAQGEEK